MKKILILESEETLRNDLCSMYRSKNVETISVRNMEDAEYVIKRFEPDVMIAEPRLTGIIGPESLEIIPYVRKKSPLTRLVIITGEGSPEMEKLAYRKGAFLYMDKPLDMKTLKSKLKKIGL